MGNDFYPIFLFGSPFINSLDEISLIFRGFPPSFVRRPSTRYCPARGSCVSLVFSMFTKEWNTARNTDFKTALNDSIKVLCFTGSSQEGNCLKYYPQKSSQVILWTFFVFVFFCYFLFITVHRVSILFPLDPVVSKQISRLRKGKNLNFFSTIATFDVWYMHVYHVKFIQISKDNSQIFYSSPVLIQRDVEIEL